MKKLEIILDEDGIKVGMTTNISTIVEAFGMLEVAKLELASRQSQSKPTNQTKSGLIIPEFRTPRNITKKNT